MSFENDVKNILGLTPLGDANTSPSVRQHTTRLDNTVKLRRRISANIHVPKPFATNLKIIISGDFVEKYIYQDPIVVNLPHRNLNNFGSEKDRSEEYSKRTGTRRSFKVKRIIHTNFKNHFKFITLTLRDTDKANVKNVDYWTKYLEKFLRRLKYKFPNIKYVWVIEFQDKKKRGAVHFHLVCNLPFAPKKMLENWWGAGWVKINRRTLDRASGYMAKYLAKSVDDPRLKSKRAYSSSRNLKQPVTLYGYDAEKIIPKLDEIKPSYKKKYETKRNGDCEYSVYNTLNSPAPKDSS